MMRKLIVEHVRKIPFKGLFMMMLMAAIAITLGMSVGMATQIEESSGQYAWAQDDESESSNESSTESSTSREDDEESESSSSRSTPEPEESEESEDMLPIDADNGDQIDPIGGTNDTISDDVSGSQGERVYDWYADRNAPFEANEHRTSAHSSSPASYRDMALGINDGDGEKWAITAMSDASKYLAFNRWHSSMTLPSPGDFEGIGFNSVLSVVGMMGFAIAGIIFYAIGFGLSFALGVNLLSGGMVYADLVFARVISFIIGTGDNTTTEAMGRVILYTFTAVVAIVAWRIFRPQQNTVQSMLKPVGLFLGGLIIIAFVGAQSAKNHAEFNTDNPSEVGQISETGHSSVAQLASNPSSWAPGSIGWAVSGINAGSKEFGSVVNSVTSVVIGAISAGFSSSQGRVAPGECDLYTSAMHSVYMSTPAAQTLDRGGLMVSYDKMVLNTMFNLYRLSSSGDTEGSHGSWCRVVEAKAGSAPGEQAMISRAAGLYPELVGKGGLGLVTGDGNDDRNTSYIIDPFNEVEPWTGGRSSNVTSGTLVAADGNWVSSAGQDNIKAATRFFGPTYASKAGAYEARFYFAGCSWEQGSPVKLREEWTGTIRANMGEELTDASCGDSILSGDPNTGGFGWLRRGDSSDIAGADQQWNYSPFIDDQPAEEDVLFEEKDDDNWGEKAIKWIINRTSPDALVSAKNMVKSINGMSIDSKNETLSKFDNAEKSGYETFPAKAYSYANAYHQVKPGNAPREYWQVVSGQNSMETMIYGVAAACLGLLLLKPMGGLVLGALGSQVIAVVILIVMAFLFILLLLPIEAVREAYKAGALTVVTSFFVTAILQFLFMLIISLSMVLLSLAGSDTAEGLAQAGIVTFIYWGVFKAAFMVINKIFGIDLSNISGVAKTLSLAGSPALNRMAGSVVSPIDDMMNRFRRKPAEYNSAGGGSQRNAEIGSRDSIASLDKTSGRSKMRMEREAERKAKVDSMVPDSMKDEKKNAIPEKKKEKGKISDKWKNSRMGKIANDKNVQRFAKPIIKKGLKGAKAIPYVGVAATSAEGGYKAFKGYKNARDMVANTWAKGKDGVNSFKDMLNHISNSGVNESDIGDFEVSSAKGAENWLGGSDYSKHRAPDIDLQAQKLANNPFRNLVGGAAREMVDSTLIPANVSREELSKYETVAHDGSDLDVLSKNASGMLPSHNVKGGVSAESVSNELTKVLTLLSSSNDVERADASEVTSAINNLSASRSMDNEAFINAFRDMESTAQAMGADYAPFPMRVPIEEAQAAGIAIVPGSDSHGEVFISPDFSANMNTMGNNPELMSAAAASWMDVQTGLDMTSSRLSALTSQMAEAVENSNLASGGAFGTVGNRQVASSVSSEMMGEAKRLMGASGADVSQQLIDKLDNIATEIRDNGFITRDAIGKMNEIKSQEPVLSSVVDNAISKSQSFGMVDNSLTQRMSEQMLAHAQSMPEHMKDIASRTEEVARNMGAASRNMSESMSAFQRLNDRRLS